MAKIILRNPSSVHLFKLIGSLFFLFSFVVADQAFAITTEVGTSYGRKKTTFDQNNFSDMESITGSLSFYFLEKLAFEMSYTEATGLRQEYVLGNKQLTYQKTTVVGGDLILILLDKTSPIQPYIKGGAARITRRQEIKYATLDPIIVEPEIAIVPSYGAGMKIAIASGFGIRLSYDVWKTPVGDGTTSDDTNIRAGVTFMF
jgi:hypothetical protein